MACTSRASALAALVCAAITGFSSCRDDLDRQWTTAVNNFTVNLYKQLPKENSLVCSPLSLDILLSLLRIGSGGATGQELTKALGYQGPPVLDTRDDFRQMMDKLGRGNGTTLEVANSLWIQKDFEIKRSFLDEARNDFRTEVSNVDFAGNASGTKDAINKWSSDKTRGLIPELFKEPLPASTILALVNAIYFKGQWHNKFKVEKTESGNFYNDGSQDKISRVKLMNQRATFLYLDDDSLNAQILEMDYSGQDMSMILILPRIDSNLNNLEEVFTLDTFDKAVSSLRTSTVDVTIPRFEIKSEFDLVNPIKGVGIQDMFQPSANFSGIANGIYVSKANQKAFIKVYEEGSEAAVVTRVTMHRMAMTSRNPQVFYFRADRPFVYLIRDKRTNLILFMGRAKSLPNVS